MFGDYTPIRLISISSRYAPHGEQRVKDKSTKFGENKPCKWQDLKREACHLATWLRSVIKFWGEFTLLQ